VRKEPAFRGVTLFDWKVSDGTCVPEYSMQARLPTRSLSSSFRYGHCTASEPDGNLLQDTQPPHPVRLSDKTAPDHGIIPAPVSGVKSTPLEQRAILAPSEIYTKSRAAAFLARRSGER
jgi:hypothetical protein